MSPAIYARRAPHVLATTHRLLRAWANAGPDGDNSLTAYAVGLLGEYLSESWLAALRERLGVEPPPVAVGGLDYAAMEYGAPGTEPEAKKPKVRWWPLIARRRSSSCRSHTSESAPPRFSLGAGKPKGAGQAQGGRGSPGDQGRQAGQGGGRHAKALWILYSEALAMRTRIGLWFDIAGALVFRSTRCSEHTLLCVSSSEFYGNNSIFTSAARLKTDSSSRTGFYSRESQARLP